MDSYSLYFTGLILAGAFVIALLCYDYLQAHGTNQVFRDFGVARSGGTSQSPNPETWGTFYILLLFAVLGMEVIICSAHLIAFFLGVEILSVSLYGLIGYTRGHHQSLESAVKYLVLAATASAFLLFGIALIYAETGSMSLMNFWMIWAHGHLSHTWFLGWALLLVGVGFKLAVVPFHMWSPDVYQGAPAPVTALIATGSKGAVLVFLLRFVAPALPHTPLSTAIAVLSVASMIVGNLLALMQTNVKRLLAYSSIAHLGYLLIPLLARAGGASSIAFYLVSYFATTIAAFGVITVISSSRATGDVENLRDYRGLGHRHPILAAVFALAMLSLTGIPPTAGFIAKFFIFAAAAQSGLWWLLIVGVVNSGISAFYYLRVLVAVYAPPEADTEPLPGAKPLAAIALALCTTVILAFGVYPAPLIRLADFAMRVYSTLK